MSRPQYVCSSCSALNVGEAEFCHECYAPKPRVDLLADAKAVAGGATAAAEQGENEDEEADVDMDDAELQAAIKLSLGDLDEAPSAQGDTATEEPTAGEGTTANGAGGVVSQSVSITMLHTHHHIRSSPAKLRPTTPNPNPPPTPTTPAPIGVAVSEVPDGGEAIAAPSPLSPSSSLSSSKLLWWCLHESCLGSVQPFASEAALTQHMAEVHGVVEEPSTPPVEPRDGQASSPTPPPEPGMAAPAPLSVPKLQRWKSLQSLDEVELDDPTILPRLRVEVDPNGLGAAIPVPITPHNLGSDPAASPDRKSVV